MKRDLSFLAVLSKPKPKPAARPNVMGVDVNSSKIAASIVGKDKALRLTYYGRDVSTMQFRFEGEGLDSKGIGTPSPGARPGSSSRGSAEGRGTALGQ